MTLAEPTVSAVVVREILDECARLGADPAALRRDAGVTLGAGDPVLSRVPLRASERLVLLALERTGCDELGLRVGARALTRVLPVMGHLLLAARSLEDALAISERYQPLVVDGLRLRVERTWDGATPRASAIITLPDVGTQHGHFIADVVLATVVQIARDVVGDGIGEVDIWLRRPAPADRAPYDALSGFSVRFGAASDRIGFDASLLTQRRAVPDAALTSMIGERAEALLARLDAEIPFGQRVARLAAGAPDLSDLVPERVARELGVATRTLQRRLRAEGTNFSAVIDAERRRRALRAVADDAKPLKEIAHEIGFSEPSAFHRAFKRWTGVSPARYREAR